MSHWAWRYIGQPWRPDQDCLYWFRRISLEQFGREVPLCRTDAIDDGRHLLVGASRVMAGDIQEAFGYRQTDAPVEGDAVFLTQRNRPHHIGIMVMVDGQLQVLHALDGAHVVLSDAQDLALNGWKVTGYYTYAN